MMVAQPEGASSSYGHGSGVDVTAADEADLMMMVQPAADAACSHGGVVRSLASRIPKGNKKHKQGVNDDVATPKASVHKAATDKAHSNAPTPKAKKLAKAKKMYNGKSS